MNDNIRELEEITKVLLKSEDNFGELKQAIDDLEQLFLSVTEFDVHNPEIREDIHLSTGKAIGPLWAAMCVKEILRTKRFISGLYQGIRAALERFTSPIRILYAGTGPFATLAIPLTTVFSSEEIHFTFLDINPKSIQYVKKIIRAFAAEEYVIQIVQGDATEFRSDQPFHLIITETMQNALQKEPQVSITMNLVPQIVPDGILIPQNIIVEAALLNPKKNDERIMGLTDSENCYHILGKIFELNKNTARQFSSSNINIGETSYFPEVVLAFPQDVSAGFRQLCLLTTIQVYDEVILNHWQCSLNLPMKLMELDLHNSKPNWLSFQYLLSAKPGFKYSIL